MIGLQTASLEAISAPLSKQAEVQPVVGLDVKATELLIEKLSEQLLQDPQNPQLLLQKGILLADSGKLQLAFDIFESLRVAFPDQPAPYVNLASIYARWGQLEEARSMLMKSSSLQSDRLQTQLSLASVHMGLAFEALTKARAINPGDMVVQTQLQALERFMGEPSAASATGMANNTGIKSAGKHLPLKVETGSRRERPKRNKATGQRVDRLKVENLDLSADPSELSTRSGMDSVGGTRKAQEDEVRATLGSWAKAWSAKSFESYATHYSAAFEPSDGTTLELWKQRRKTLIESPSFIQVDIKINNLQVDGPMASVRLLQTYRSDRYSDKVRKDLLLRLEGTQWRLLSERAVD